ncbi:putative protein yqkD [Fibrisoma limi BUZ 3]|uniref:Serine aminopeptidase S33 domain-containing protein n=1 Tax=Fibrisoma limi BUZ 3 TaxID=1185876 RepID=I2GK26_9BACT|nr:alpha/beta fold hydrolase [Fibrisoma limi]CCH54251.1 putative protein yqkD [Fibrisoma limi BUZ 3]
MRIAGISLLVLFVLLNGVVAFHAARFTYFYDNPEQEPRRKLDSYSTLEKLQIALFGWKHMKSAVHDQPGFSFQTVQLVNDRHQKLEGWYGPIGQAKGTVILCHGHGTNKSDVLCEAAYFRTLGYNTFLFDFRAHGNSEGNVCTLGFHETNDLKVAYDYVVRMGEKNIVLWGRSMGASIILKAIPEWSLKPSRVILECPFASISDAVEGRLRTLHVPVHPVSELLMFWGSTLRLTWMFDFQPSANAKQLTMPVLLNWGGNDQRVLRQETDLIFKNLGASRKELAIFEQSAHESYCVRESARWQTIIHRFLQTSSKAETNTVDQTSGNDRLHTQFRETISPDLGTESR